MCMGVSSKVVQNEQRAMFVIPKAYSFLLRKSTLLRTFYWKERKVILIVANSCIINSCVFKHFIEIGV